MKKPYMRPEATMMALRVEERLAGRCWTVNSGIGTDCTLTPNFDNDKCTNYGVSNVQDGLS